MSFKVYNGYKLPNMTLAQLTEFHRQTSKKMNEALKQFCYAHYAKMATLKIDQITLGTLPKPESNYENFIGDVESDFYRLVMSKTVYDLESSVTYYPMDGKILCMFFGSDLFKDIWEKIEGVEEYGFWDNTDPCEKCTDEEWDLREKEWKGIFDNYQTPQQQGLLSIFTESKVWMIRDYGVEGRIVETLVPEMQERIDLVKSMERTLNMTDSEIEERLIKKITKKMLTTGVGI